MAELGAAASVIGVATAALQSMQFLRTTIDNIKNVPDTIRNIKVDIQSVEPVLHNLDAACRSDNTQIILSPNIQSAVESCSGACKEFGTLIGHWMRHSSEDKTFWVDRWRVGVFGQERIKTFKSQLNDCKSTLSVTLSTATMYVLFYTLYFDTLSISYVSLTNLKSITMTRQQGVCKR